jgi:hypothetical protein
MWTKLVSKHDRIEFDGTDVSNLFRRFDADTVFEVYWQPNGLVNPSARAFWADCQMFRFGPENQRGSVSVMPFSAKPATEDGLQSAAGT